MAQQPKPAFKAFLEVFVNPDDLQIMVLPVPQNKLAHLYIVSRGPRGKFDKIFDSWPVIAPREQVIGNLAHQLVTIVDVVNHTFENNEVQLLHHLEESDMRKYPHRVLTAHHIKKIASELNKEYVVETHELFAAH